MTHQLVIVMRPAELTSFSRHGIIHGMRTTISIDDDALELVKRYAASRSLALGKAVSELVRRAFTIPHPTREVNGVQVFDVPPESPRVTMKKVLELDAG
jgi:predicted DNA-binding ribbon-helix-helix protein